MTHRCPIRGLMFFVHRYIQLLAVASALLITAGGLVTSTGSGLAVPDWPNSYGYFMFAFPFSSMVGGIFYEHGHRLIASIVGIFTIGLVVLLARQETRKWVRQLGWIVLAAVIVQGLLGGITVLFFLPTPISVSHAGLAHLFLSLVVSLGVFTSPGWKTSYARSTPINDQILSRLAICTPIFIYAQILIGATMRHTGAGLAIPDFPLAFGQLLPSTWTAAISINFAHRAGAAIVTMLVFAEAGHVLAHHWARLELRRPAVLLVGLVLMQIFLGGWTVLSGKHYVVNTSHVITGSALLATAILLTLRVHRDRFTNDATRERTKKSSLQLPLRKSGIRS